MDVTGEKALAIYEILVSGKGISAIADKAGDLFKNPIVVVTLNCRVIAAAAFPENDALFEQVRTSGYLPTQYFDALAKNPRYMAIYRAEEPVIVSDVLSERRVMAFRIGTADAPAGAVFMWECEHEFDAEDKPLFHTLCRVINTEQRSSSPAYEARKKSFEYVIEEILEGRLSGDRMRQQLLSMGIEPKKPRCLFVIQNSDDSKLYAEYIRSKVENIFHRCHYAVYNNRLLVLAESTGKGLLEPEERSALKSFLTDNGFLCGCSSRFVSMNTLPEVYRQAVTAARIGRQMDGHGPIFYMWEYAVYHMCDMLNGTCNLLEFCNPLIIAIRQYDLINGTDFLQTMRAFVESGCRPVETAQALGVHRNTVDYRLGRIRELFGVNYDDQRMMFSFGLSFQVLYYLEKQQWQQ